MISLTRLLFDSDGPVDIRLCKPHAHDPVHIGKYRCTREDLRQQPSGVKGRNRLQNDRVSHRLKSFGWAVLANLKSPSWEHPLLQYLQYFFKEVPKCLASQKAISTQHIYLTDPTKLTCPAGP
ncbi:hypothetical protein OS493_012752 [Desmophyllum pertusum]|uniref:Uncharacterized protein n=1 Tax=Desmophyllum pertusum TaxID=174260 RepID=A0A9W9ZER9_9CNID|nr:hypothetical protein OS493_012752 [Desmophyllum pertusum]